MDNLNTCDDRASVERALSTFMGLGVDNIASADRGQLVADCAVDCGVIGLAVLSDLRRVGELGLLSDVNSERDVVDLATDGGITSMVVLDAIRSVYGGVREKVDSSIS